MQKVAFVVVALVAIVGGSTSLHCQTLAPPGASTSDPDMKPLEDWAAAGGTLTPVEVAAKGMAMLNIVGDAKTAIETIVEIHSIPFSAVSPILWDTFFGAVSLLCSAKVFVETSPAHAANADGSISINPDHICAGTGGGGSGATALAAVAHEAVHLKWRSVKRADLPDPSWKYIDCERDRLMDELNSCRAEKLFIDAQRMLDSDFDYCQALTDLIGTTDSYASRANAAWSLIKEHNNNNPPAPASQEIATETESELAALDDEYKAFAGDLNICWSLYCG